MKTYSIPALFLLGMSILSGCSTISDKQLTPAVSNSTIPSTSGMVHSNTGQASMNHMTIASE